jgi:hypothetical protein
MNKKEKLNGNDVGMIDDSINILIDLVHIEHHSWKSFNETKNKEWLEISNEARMDRTELLTSIINNKLFEEDGELWCFDKHSLKVIGGYVELGNREYTLGNLEKSILYYEKASKWLGIFLIKNKIKGG